MTGIGSDAKQQERVLVDPCLLYTSFAALVRYASENHYTHIAGEYSPTAKNSQVADLYHRLGCAAAGHQRSEAGESRLFRWETGKVFPAPSMIDCADLTQRAGTAV